ncbi:MAG: hypothetical protein ACKVSF_07735 [Alphaproteobacteria bacterium]
MKARTIEPQRGARRRRDLPVTILLCLAATIAGAFGAEYYLFRQLADAPLRASERLGLVHDTRSVRQVVDELRKVNPAAVPALWPSYLLVANGENAPRSMLMAGGVETVPAGGVSRAQTVMCREVGGYNSYASDRHGFNNPDWVWQLPETDIALIGDSFTQGQCVPPGDQVAALVRSHFPATLALAMGHDGPLMELLTLKEFAAFRRPRAVVWLFYQGNDLTQDLPRERASPLLMRYLEGDYTQSLAVRQAEIDSALRTYLDSAASRERHVAELETRAARESVLKLRNLRHLLGATRAPPSPDFALLGRILLEAKATVEGWGGQTIFVYLPSWIELLHPNQAMRMGREAALAAARENGFEIVDLHAAMAAARDPGAYFYYPASHYSPEGQRVLADAILAALAASGIKPSSP